MDILEEISLLLVGLSVFMGRTLAKEDFEGYGIGSQPAIAMRFFDRKWSQP